MFVVVVTDVDSVLLRMTIIGVLLSFRSLAQEALNDVSKNQPSLCIIMVRSYN